MRIRAALALVAVASIVHAQERDQSLGPWFNGFYSHASGTTVDGDVRFIGPVDFSTGAGAGGGLSIGYGVAPWLSVFANLDNAGNQPITTTGGLAIQGSLLLQQIDAGVRAQLPIHKIRLTPYGILAYSSRWMSGFVTGFPGATTQGTLTTWGSAWTYGAGLEFFFARAFSIDASWQQTSGTYARWMIPTTAVFPTSASTSKESRVLAGVTWHAGPQGPPSEAAANPPLELGQTVHVYAGTRTVGGTIVYLGRDTLIVQQVVNDLPAQTAVPIACISRVNRLRDETPMAPSLFKGATLGGIAGGLIAAIVSENSSGAPKKLTGTFGAWVLGGAVVGGGIAAIVNLTGDRFRPAPPLPRPEISQADLAKVCAPWNPIQ